MMNNYDPYYNYMNDMNYINPAKEFDNLNTIANVSYDYMHDNHGNKLNLSDPYTGFTRGNLFDNLYAPYKNYHYEELQANTEQEQILYELSMYTFAAHEINLYLDNYPNDNEAIRIRDEYLGKSKSLRNTYESRYGALDVSSETLNKTPWGWDTKAWPWEGDI